MKKLVALLAGAVFMIGASSAWSLTIENGTINVGDVDTKIGETTLLSGDAAELAWVQSILGDDITFVIKHDNFSNDDWKQTNENGTWAFQLSDSPDYFLVKTGNNGTNNYVDYLFTNNEYKSWAVLDLNDIYVTAVLNIGKVSHLSDYNGAPVPEPGTILLLGAGLLGLGFYGRRRMRA